MGIVILGMVNFCRFYVYYACFILAQVVQCGFASGQSQFLDVDRIKLGYETTHARYVGRLYEVYEYPYRSCETVVPAGSIAYYTDGFCFTDAHCIDERGGWSRYFDPDRYFKIGYRVSFEIEDGRHIYFNILAYKIHEGYEKEGVYCDIALLRLDKVIEEFKEAKDVYDFTQYKSSLFTIGKCVEAGDKLTSIGYGHAGEEADYCVKFDAHRRGCQSKLFSIQNSRLILSMPYQVDLIVLSKNEYCLESRTPYQNESILRENMSGGITLMNGRIVGLIHGSTYNFLSYKDYFIAMFLHYAAYFVNQVTLSSVPKLRGSHAFKGVMAGSLMLGPHKQWIDNSCAESWNTSHTWVKNNVWGNNVNKTDKMG